MRNRVSSAKWFGLLAALALLLFQTFGFGLAAGAAALPASLDVFGNPLCAHADEGGGSGSGHPAIPECCTTACAVHLHVLAPAPLEAAIIERDWVALARPAASRPVYPPAPDHVPGRPRAPPAA